MDSFEQFTRLPPEIQREILKMDPTTLKRSLFLNKQYMEQLGRAACDRPISNREFEQYILDAKPRIFGLYAQLHLDDGINYNCYEPEFLSVYRLYTPNFVYSSGHWVESGLETVIYRVGNSEAVTFEIEPVQTRHDLLIDRERVLTNFGKFRGIDLLTMYRILKRRTVCLRLDPEYAVDQVRAEFGRKIEEFNQIIPRDYGLVLDLLLYLNLQALVFNIEHPDLDQLRGIRIQVLEDGSVVDEEMAQLVDRLDSQLAPFLIDEIWKRLDVIQ